MVAPDTAPRRSRLAATAIDALVLLTPGFPVLGLLADSQGPRGLGGFGVLLVLCVASGVSAALVLLAQLAIVGKRARTIGMAYMGLALGGAERRWRWTPFLADAAVFAVFAVSALFVLALAPDFIDGPSGTAVVVVAAPALALVFNLAPLLGPSRRTMGDRLGGARVVVVQRAPPAFFGASVGALAVDFAVTAAATAPTLVGASCIDRVEEARGLFLGGGVGAFLVLGIQAGALRATRETMGMRALERVEGSR